MNRLKEMIRSVTFAGGLTPQSAAKWRFVDRVRWGGPRLRPAGKTRLNDDDHDGRDFQRFVYPRQKITPGAPE